MWQQQFCWKHAVMSQAMLPLQFSLSIFSLLRCFPAWASLQRTSTNFPSWKCKINIFLACSLLHITPRSGERRKKKTRRRRAACATMYHTQKWNRLLFASPSIGWRVKIHFASFFASQRSRHASFDWHFSYVHGLGRERRETQKTRLGFFVSLNILLLLLSLSSRRLSYIFINAHLDVQ